MSLFGNRRIEIRTELQPEEVRRILSSSIVPNQDIGRRLFSGLTEPYQYKGSFDASTFSVSRINSRGRNLRTLIFGEIRPGTNGTIIILSFERHNRDITFLFFFLSVIVFLVIPSSVSFIKSFFHGEINILLLLCGIFPVILMLIITLGMYYLAFNYEIKFATKYFSELFIGGAVAADPS
jgi:hypothetical protein